MTALQLLDINKVVESKDLIDIRFDIRFVITLKRKLFVIIYSNNVDTFNIHNFKIKRKHALNLLQTLAALTEPRLDFKNSVIMIST